MKTTPPAPRRAAVRPADYRRVLTAILALLASPCFAQPTPDAPSPLKTAQVVFTSQPDAPQTATFTLGGSEAQLGRLERIALDPADVPADAADLAHVADRITVREPATRRWGVQLSADLSADLQPGRLYHLTGYARCIESTTGDGTFVVKIEHNAEPWGNALARGLSFGKTWSRFDYPFVVPRNPAFLASQTQITFHLGAARQTLELAGVRLLLLNEGIDAATLPRTRLTYAGREADAPWRAQAAERIDRLRKADLTLQLLDAHDAPLAGATVQIEQLTHAFPFGTALSANYFNSDKPGVPQYRQALLERFNGIVLENALKWGTDAAQTRNAAGADAALDFAETHDLHTRGHVLIWPGLRHVPEDVRQLTTDLRANPNSAELRAQLQQRIADRIRDTMTRYAGRLDDWDVVNEPYTNHDLLDALDTPDTPAGTGAMADWFKLAHAADPHARLFLNEYGILTASSLQDPHLQHFFNTARGLLSAGAPLHGLGMQGHFGAHLTPPTQLWQTLDHFATLGLPIKATEFDVAADDPQLIADYTRDFYTALFAHPAVEGIYTWGFWAGAHWRPDAAFLDEQFRPRPSDHALRQLLDHDWRTHTTATADPNGRLTLRAFPGQYRLTVTHAGRTTYHNLTLPADGTIAELRN